MSTAIRSRATSAATRNTAAGPAGRLSNSTNGPTSQSRRASVSHRPSNAEATLLRAAVAESDDADDSAVQSGLEHSATTSSVRALTSRKPAPPTSVLGTRHASGVLSKTNSASQELTVESADRILDDCGGPLASDSSDASVDPDEEAAHKIARDADAAQAAATALQEQRNREEQELNQQLLALPLDASVLASALSMLSVCPETLQETFVKMSLPGQNLSSLAFLQHYPHLQILELAGNGLTSAAVLGELPWLTHVDLSNNKLTSMLDFACASPSNLQVVDLSRNQISAIANLKPHKYLRTLVLDRNLISHIPADAFASTRMLTRLGLAHNAISSLGTALDGLHLQALNLTHNRLRTIEGLETLVELADLRLGDNSIETLKGLCENRSLRLLHLQNNFIDSLEHVEAIEHLQLLSELVLEHNPLAKDANYRYFVLHRMPHLLKLDSSAATVEERVAARNCYDPPIEGIAALAHNAELRESISKFAKITLAPAELARPEALKPVIVLCGASGPARRRLKQRLMASWPQLFGLTISHTTRKPKPWEVSGIHYYFCSSAEMDAMIARGQFLQVVSMFGNMYGTRLDAVESVVQQDKMCLCELELDGILMLKQAGLNARFVHVASPNEKPSEQRFHVALQADSLAPPQGARPYKGRQGRRESVMYGYGCNDADRLLYLANDAARAVRSPETPSSTVERSSNVTPLPPVAAVDDLHHAQIETDEQYSQYRSRKQALEAASLSHPGFFDVSILTDDFDEAYRQLEAYCLKQLSSESL